MNFCSSGAARWRIVGATDRAGTPVAFEEKELGLGVVNPRTEQVETPAEIRSAVEKAYPAECVFLNPDCGFGAFSDRPMNTREIAFPKARPWPPRPENCADVRDVRRPPLA